MPVIVSSGSSLKPRIARKIEKNLFNLDNKINEIFNRFPNRSVNEMVNYLSSNTISYDEFNEYYNCFKYCHYDDLVDSIMNVNVNTSNKLKEISVILKKESLKKIKDKNYNKTYCKK